MRIAMLAGTAPWGDGSGGAPKRMNPTNVNLTSRLPGPGGSLEPAVSDHTSCSQSGPGAQVVELASALRSRGHEVHIFAPTSARRSYYESADGLHYHVMSRQNRRVSWWNDLAQSTLYYLRSTERVAGQFDVVHGHHRAFLPVLGEVTSTGHARTFLTLHSDLGLMASPPPTRDASWTPLDAVERVVASSLAIKEKVVEALGIPGEKVEVIYPGVALNKYSRWVDQGNVKMGCGFGPADPTILYVGEMTRAGGPDVLLEATFAVSQSYPRARTIFVGDGPMLPYLRDRASTLGLAAATRFCGFIDDESLVNLYNACDIVCLPLRAGRAEQTVLEAWCAGKTTIVSRATAPEFLEPGADGFVTKAEAGTVAQAVAYCLTDVPACQEIGRRVWHRVNREFSWDAIAAKTLEMYSH